MVDVFVVAPIRVHRESLSIALNTAEGLSVVGAAATLAEALPRLRELRPDAALVDVSMLDDLDVPLSHTSESEAKLVAVGVPENEAVAWIEAGVYGYVPPEASLDELTLALERVAAGQLVTSPEVAAHLLTRIRRRSAAVRNAAGEGSLTPRETEVLRLIEEGLSNKVIARRLTIQEQTVKNHVHNILVKLGVHSRVEAATRMRAQGYQSSAP